MNIIRLKEIALIENTFATVLIISLGIVNTISAPAVILFFSVHALLQSIISLDILAILFS